MMNSIKIRTRLALSFGLLILMMLGAAGAGVYGLRRVSAYMHEAIDKRAEIDNLLAGTMNQVNIVARSSFGVLLIDGGDKQKELERISDGLNNIDGNIEKVSKMISSSEERELLDSFMKAKNDYNPEIKRFVTLIQEGKKETAAQLRLGEIRAIQREKYMPALENFIRYENRLARESGGKANQAETSVISTVIIFAALALILAVFLIFSITLSITKPLDEGIKVMDRLSSGNLTGEFTIKGRDELGQLLSAMKVMVEKLKAIITAVRFSIRSCICQRRAQRKL